MCLNLAEILETSFEEDPSGAANPIEDVELSEDGFETPRLRGSQDRQFFLVLVFSLGVHAAVLALCVLVGFPSSPAIPEQPFITVNMVAMDGSGGGPGGARGGSGSASASASDQPGSSPSPGLGNAGPDPAQTALQEVRPVKDAVEKKSEIRPQMRRPQIIKPRHASRVPSKPTADQTSPSVEARAKPAGDPDNSISMHSSAAPGVSNGDPGQGNPGSGGLSSGLGTGLGDGGSGRGGGGSGEFGLKQVDTPPVPIRKVEPEFPSEALQMGISGRVVLRFLVKTDGKVAKASVLEADPPGFFEQSAMEAIDRWRFKPGHYRGNAVATWVDLPIRFRLTK